MIGHERSLALVNAKLRSNTSNDDATALLIEDGVITQVGDDALIRASVPTGVEVIDAGGATVTPGLWDSHSHPDFGAFSTRGIDLGGVGTLAELREILGQASAELGPDEWLEAWNLEYEMFEETGIDRSTFEDIVGDRPTMLFFYDGHTGLASLSALHAAGVQERVSFPDGSEVVEDASGRLTGELKEMTALRLIAEAIPALDIEAELESLEQVFYNFAATGITGCAVMDGSSRTRELLAHLETQGRLTQRVVVHEWHKVHFDDADQERIIAARDEKGYLWEGGAIKLFSDGVVDTGTALLHEKDSHGEGLRAAWPDWDHYKRVLRQYHDAGFLIATHAVGDRAVNDVIDAYAELPDRGEGYASHTIEHLEVMSDADVEKLGKTTITASMQPLHMQWRKDDHSDNWTQRLGSDRWGTGYRCKSALNAGARVVLGSDWPVAEYDPRIGMAWARGRKTPGAGHSEAFEPEERLTGEEALLAYTLWPAIARGHDDRGHLSVGALGDLTVFAKDPTEVLPEDLPELEIKLTVVDGKVTFRAE